MAAAQPPAGDSAPAPTPPQAEGGQQGSGTTEGQPSGTADYMARARSDPDWAAEQVRTHQSRADKAEGANRELNDWLGNLTRYREQGLSGSDLAGHLETYSRLLSDPAMKKVIEGYVQTGKMPGPSESAESSIDEDAYLTEEQKELRALRAENQQLKASQGETNLAVSGIALQGHLDRVQREYGLSPERFEQVKQDLQKQIGDWQGAGAAGEQAMKKLMSPEGYSTVNLLIKSRSDYEEIVREKLLRDNGLRQQLATDVPSGGASRGGEPPPIFKTGLEAVQWARAHPDEADDFIGGI